MTRRLRLALASILAVAALGAIAPAANATVYWANSGNSLGTTIGSANDDGTSPNQSLISGITWPRDVAVDSSHLYWTGGSLFSGVIGTAGLDGSNPNQSFISSSSCDDGGSLYLPWGIEVTSDYIYWIDLYTEKIGRSTLDGNTVECSWFSPPATGYAVYQGLAVDSNYIYWSQTQVNDNPGKIGRARLDGTDSDPAFITEGVSSPTAIALSSNRLFWSDEYRNYIGRANKDGDPASVNADFFDVQRPQRGLAYSNGSLLWSSWQGDRIGKGPMGGGAPGTGSVFAYTSPYPAGVAVTATTAPKPVIATSGRPTKRSLKVRVGCGDSGDCKLLLTGRKVGTRVQIAPKTVTVDTGESPVVTLAYSKALRRSLAKGGRLSITATKLNAVGASRTLIVRVRK